jgi:hypothetical protein
MVEFLVNTPWWWPASLAVLGVVVFVRANARRQTHARFAGLLVIAGAIGWAIIGFYIDSPIERCVKGTQRLVEAFDRQDWSRLGVDLAPNAHLALLDVPISLYTSRDEIVANARAADEMYDFQRTRISTSRAVQDPRQITVTITVRTESTFTGGRPFPSDWKLDWRKTDQGWRVVEITALQIGNLPPEQAVHNFPDR